MLARIYGIDVSHYQGTINWTQVLAAGKKFAFIKSSGSDGTTAGAANGNYTDAQFSTYAAGAAAAGVKFGVYHFADLLNSEVDAVGQATYFVNVAHSRMTTGYLPPVLDLENGAGTLSVSALSAWATSFCTTVRNLTGVTPIIYCNSSYATSSVDTSLAQFPLWIANYNFSESQTQTSNPTVGNATHGWPAGTWKFWQYSDSGTISGINDANVDLDVLNGDDATLSAMLIRPAAINVAVDGSALTAGQSTPVNFGAFTQGQANVSKSFLVTNSGGLSLSLGTLNVPAGYLITDPLAATLAPGASDTFTLTLDTSTAGTKAGTVAFSTSDQLQPNFTFPVTALVGDPDLTPPTVASANFNFNASPHKISFTFSEDVGSTVALADFVATNVSRGIAIFPSTFAYNAATFTATVGFSGALPDGNYRLTLPAGTVSDSASNALAADFSYDFFVLAGDANRDRHVDIADLGILAANWQQSGRTFSQGDFNYSGTVDVADLGLLAANWQITLAAPPPALAASPFAKMTKLSAWQRISEPDETLPI